MRLNYDNLVKSQILNYDEFEKSDFIELLRYNMYILFGGPFATMTFHESINYRRQYS